MVGLLPRVKNGFVELCMGYDLLERGRRIWVEAEQKWEFRKLRLSFEKRIRMSPGQEDVLSYIPSEAIELINLYSRLCPRCKRKRMDPSHLKEYGIEVPEPVSLMQRINEDILEVKKRSFSLGEKFARLSAMRPWAEYCKMIIKRIRVEIYMKMDCEL
jgi:hypothetical protein